MKAFFLKANFEIENPSIFEPDVSMKFVTYDCKLCKKGTFFRLSPKCKVIKSSERFAKTYQFCQLSENFMQIRV